MRTRYVSSLVAVAVVAAMMSDGAAAAPPTGTWLWLTVAAGETATPVSRQAWLRCRPAGGTHPRPRETCVAIAAVRGDLTALKPAGGFCTMQYAPTTVTASGRWKGRRVRYRHTFSNECVLYDQTGPVFRL
jgi:hypothetical protein